MSAAYSEALVAIDALIYEWRATIVALEDLRLKCARNGDAETADCYRRAIQTHAEFVRELSMARKGVMPHRKSKRLFVEPKANLPDQFRLTVVVVARNLKAAENWWKIHQTPGSVMCYCDRPEQIAGIRLGGQITLVEVEGWRQDKDIQFIDAVERLRASRGAA